ncbi:unnamed protein product [Dovyalis caffra]|uniref:Uncharacterized protein n=1 Tax=Dovyalis caffra TaxID=77055 RepID=A0AAV1STB7_9ROSI|nr:unnamed protein product [Dovyalis caffra]
MAKLTKTDPHIDGFKAQQLSVSFVGTTALRHASSAHRRLYLLLVNKAEGRDGSKAIVEQRTVARRIGELCFDPSTTELR